MPIRPGDAFRKAQQERNKKQYDRYYDRQRASANKRGYDKKWETVRLLKLRDAPLCEMCEKNGKLVVATEVHHIVPVSEGGDCYMLDNLMSLCHSCHMKIHVNTRWGYPFS